MMDASWDYYVRALLAERHEEAARLRLLRTVDEGRHAQRPRQEDTTIRRRLAALALRVVLRPGQHADHPVISG